MDHAKRRNRRCERVPRWRPGVAVRPAGWLLMLALAGAVPGPGTAARAEVGAGDALPAWTLDTAGGHEVNFPADADGVPSVLLFWATWCPYCRALLPHIEALRTRFEPAGVRFYALNVWEDGDAAAYLHERDIGMTLLPAADLVADAYGVKGTPGVIVGDRAGRVRYVRTSGTPPEAVEATIRALLEAELAPDAQH